MDERKVFCEECRNDVTFTVTDKQMDGSIKGETYTYSPISSSSIKK